MRQPHLLMGVVGLISGALLLAGCGGSGDDGDSTATTKAATPNKPTVAAKATPPASFSGCPEGRRSYVMGTEIVAEADASIDAGEEVKAAKEYRQAGEEMLDQSYELCASEKELAAAEGNICKNSPRELAEALEVEDTPANREYIGVYEATCGRKVPLP
jgi:hypothetical protein